jgi:hypothetical protein
MIATGGPGMIPTYFAELRRPLVGVLDFHVVRPLAVFEGLAAFGWPNANGG